MLRDAESDFLRRLPPVNRVLAQEQVAGLRDQLPRGRLVVEVRAVLEGLREEILRGGQPDISLTAIAAAVEARVARARGRGLRRVINATGVILHTNLGRAVLGPRALEAVAEVGRGYSNLEYDLETGRRGSRYDHVARLLAELSGAEAALVVNNNAAAVVLTLAALAAGRSVVVSRGQLVEIGGGFRVPEVLAQSGARLIEVGTTNKTYPHDYETAIGPDTAMLLKVHTSNYRVVGFTREVTAAELVEVAHHHSLLAVEDLGSGYLFGLGECLSEPEPSIRESLAAGLDLITFSGDKLLGGPQAGIVLGRKELVNRLAAHPLTRALRVDKLTLAALEGTLQEYRDGYPQGIPAIMALTMPLEEITVLAEGLRAQLREVIPRDLFEVELRSGVSRVGGGALPLAELPTTVVWLKPLTLPVMELAARLRQGEPALVTHMEQGGLVINPRTLLPGEAGEVVACLQQALQGDTGDFGNDG